MSDRTLRRASAGHAGEPFIQFARPSIGEREIQAVVDCMRSGWLTTGPIVQRFEQEFARTVGAQYALAVNSATAGLHLALEAIGIGAGDQVLTTPYTFTATAEVVRYLGADPVFADVDAATWNVDPRELRRRLNSSGQIKALLPVHFAGQACDMRTISELAAAHGLPVIDDAAHAYSATYEGRLVGSLATVSVFSFYATKPLCTGEGGMVTTGDKRIADRVRTMRLHGINRDVFDRYRSTAPAWYYEVVAPGYKYNMTDIAAAIGIVQMQRGAEMLARRTEIARQYNVAFAGLPVRIPQAQRADDVHAWHLYVIQLRLEDLKITRDRFIELMAEHGVGTSVHFIPLHIQPYWRDRYGLRPEDFPVALDCFRRSVSLPIYPDMTDDEVARVIEAVRAVLHYRSR